MAKKKKILPKEKRNDVKPYTGNTYNRHVLKKRHKERCPNIGPEHGPAHKKPLTFEEKMMKARPGMFQMCSVNIY